MIKITNLYDNFTTYSVVLPILDLNLVRFNRWPDISRTEIPIKDHDGGADGAPERMSYSFVEYVRA